MTSLTISNVTSAVVDSIAPSITNEAVWGSWNKWLGDDSTFAAFIHASSIGAELHEKSHIFHTLPRTNLQMPLAFSVLILRNTSLQETQIGGVISKNLDRIFQAARVGLIFGDYAAGRRLTATVRLVTWAYLQTPEKDLPKKVHTFMKNAITIAFWVNVGTFFWRRPVLAAVTAVTLGVIAISTFALLKFVADQEAERRHQARFGAGIAKRMGIGPQFDAFWDRPGQSLNRLVRGQSIVG